MIGMTVKEIKGRDYAEQGLLTNPYDDNMKIFVNKKAAQEFQEYVDEQKFIDYEQISEDIDFDEENQSAK
tara:strand:+ start:197 stop:406 length:210 start_codon:yes stop_codon:yes gene_type:complete